MSHDITLDCSRCRGTRPPVRKCGGEYTLEQAVEAVRAAQDIAEFLRKHPSFEIQHRYQYCWDEDLATFARDHAECRSFVIRCERPSCKAHAMDAHSESLNG